MTHNIISGTVTNRVNHVPASTVALKITKRVSVIIGVLFVAFLAFGFILQATGHGS